MIELVPGARTEEGEEENEENVGRFQIIHSPVCKRPLCDKKAPARERTRRGASLGRKKLPRKGYSLQNVAE